MAAMAFSSEAREASNSASFAVNSPCLVSTSRTPAFSRHFRNLFSAAETRSWSVPGACFLCHVGEEGGQLLAVCGTIRRPVNTFNCRPARLSVAFSAETPPFFGNRTGMSVPYVVSHLPHGLEPAHAVL